MRFSLAVAGAFALPAIAADVTLFLPVAKPNPFGLPASTHATLTSLGERYTASLTAVNTFVFHNVSDGSYLADVHCPTDGFHPLRIDIGPDNALEAWETFRGNDWANKGEALALREGKVGKGFEVRPLGGKVYFTERPKFSILSLLMNPMILMGLVSMVLFIGMPKLIENMDPETRAEFEQSQKDSPMNAILSGGGGGQATPNPLGNFDMAAYLAGSGKKEGSASGSASGSQTPNKKEGVRR